jgi:hypothetical protein
MRQIALAIALLVATQALPSGQAKTKPWTPPRTADGHPDLQGIWDYRSATPLQRPQQFAGREFMTADEAVEYERRAAEREDGRPPDDPRTEQSVHPAWWLDYGKTVVKTRRTSLIVDPPDGRIPPLTPEAQKRAAARRAETATHGPADSYENRSLFERCISRGAPEGLLPGPYNSNLHVLQTPGYVVLLTEMIHDARIVPMDGRAHNPEAMRGWMGDPRGRWEGDTLVVDTVNFSEKISFRGATEKMHLIERFTRLDADTLEYRFTVDDPATWTKPWTVAYPMVRTTEKMYEYACHEGNYGLRNILSYARWEESEAARKKQ